jgi:hypothetical protein
LKCDWGVKTKSDGRSKIDSKIEWKCPFPCAISEIADVRSQAEGIERYD